MRTRSLLVSLCSLTLQLSLLKLSGGRAMGQDAPNPGNALPPSTSALVASSTTMDVLDDRRKLAAGDRISYRVVEERRQPVSLMIADTGELEVPLLGRMNAAGRTCRELAMAIKAPLERDYFFKATVLIGVDTMTTRSPGQYYLSGQVRSQGSQPLIAGEEITLSKAVLKAGGLADFANGKKVKLVRKQSDGTTQTTIIDLDEITKKGKLDKDPVLQPDDVIIVPEKFVNF